MPGKSVVRPNPLPMDGFQEVDTGVTPVEAEEGADDMDLLTKALRTFDQEDLGNEDLAMVEQAEAGADGATEEIEA